MAWSQTSMGRRNRIDNNKKIRYMEIKINEQQIRLEGMLDSNSAADFSMAVNEILAGKDCNATWTIDMSALKYTSSQGLRLFLSLQKGLKANGGELILKSIRSSVREVFEITGLLSLFKIE